VSTPGTGKIDLRSDVKTVPDEEMRRAMAEAVVGDDMSGEDPTVNELEERSAEIMGMEAGLFVASGCMGNLVCVYTHTQPGEEIILESGCHINRYEASGLAQICGLLPRPAVGVRGRLTPAQVEELISDGSNIHTRRTGLLELENTHNTAGGTVLSVEQTRDLADVAHAHGFPVYLDGARVFNSAVALGVSVSELVAPVDSVQFCFSKNLGAPVGSMICGERGFVERCRAFRKLIGGAMRQAGVIAAAALVALEKGPGRLHEDHANARLIAETLADIEGVSIDLETVQTNLIIFDLLRDDVDAPGLCEALAAYDVLAVNKDATRIRFVTHCQVTREDTERVCAALGEILGG